MNTFRNRLARDGEDLVAHRFGSGCTGFISANSFDATASLGTRRLSWLELKTWFFPSRYGPVAVCIPPGARLTLQQIPMECQQQLGLKETEHALFIQLGAEEFSFRDGLRFRNGRAILLQRLPEGQRAWIWLATDSESRSSDRSAPEEVYG